MSTALGLVGTVVAATVAVTAYFVPRAEHEEDIHMVEAATSEYLLNLRIEQHEDRQWMLDEKAKREPLTSDEERRLERTEQRLKQLYERQLNEEKTHE